jgi:hypothetical protein
MLGVGWWVDKCLMYLYTWVVVVVVSVCVSWSDDRVTGILANSVCWWNHPGGISCGWFHVPFCLCVCMLVVCVLPCPEFIIAPLPGNWLPSPRLDRSRLRSLSASPVIGATNAWPAATQTLVHRHRFYSPLRTDGLGQLRVHSLPKSITRERADCVGSAGNRTCALKSSRP